MLKLFSPIAVIAARAAWGMLFSKARSIGNRLDRSEKTRAADTFAWSNLSGCAHVGGADSLVIPARNNGGYGNQVVVFTRGASRGEDASNVDVFSRNDEIGCAADSTGGTAVLMNVSSIARVLGVYRGVDPA